MLSRMSDPTSPGPLDDTLVLSDRLPLRWQTLGDAPPATELAHWDRRNVEVLHALLALDEGSRLGEEGGEPLAQEMLRLERKLDFVLDLLARALGEGLEVPAPVDLRLSERGLQWVAEPTIEPGTWLELELHLSDRYPIPLRLCARVVTASAEGCAATFTGVSEGGRDILAKLIFRAHRRGISRRSEEHR
jgi:hypothetical protein